MFVIRGRLYAHPVYLYSFFFVTSAFDGVFGQRHAPSASLQGKNRYPLGGP